MAGRPKGLPKTGGRRAGTPNKTTAQLKEAILGAFSEVGGQRYLARVADENPQVFCTLLGKVLPMTVAGDADNPVKVIYEWASPSE